MFGSYLGPNYSNEIRKILNDLGAIFDEISENKIISRTAKVLADKKAVGWFWEKWNLDQEHLVTD